MTDSGKKQIHIHFATVVWGELHRSLFTDVALPTLISPNNIPALAGTARLTYTIYTTHFDAVKIRNVPAFRRLREMVEIKVVAQDRFLQRDVFSEHHRYQFQEQCYARDHGAYLITIIPDIVWADGAFAYLRDRFEHGKNAVYLKCMRVSSETFIPDLLSGHPPDRNGAISVRPRALAELTLRHLHPLILAQFERAADFTNFAELLLWPLRRGTQLNGLLVGVPFPSDLLFFRPGAAKQINESQVLSESLDFDDVAFVEDSDDMMIASPTPMFSYNDWFLDRGPMDPIDVARTSLDFGTDFTAEVARRKMRIHAGNVAEADWRQAERRAGLAMHRILTLREYLRIWRVLRREGLARAAAVVSTLMHRVDRLPTIGRGDLATLFIPVDEAFGDDRGFMRLLNPDGHRALARGLRQYMVPSLFYREDLKCGKRRLRTMAGRDVVFVGDEGGAADSGPSSAGIVGGDVEAGPFLIHFIDRVLPEGNDPLRITVC